MHKSEPERIMRAAEEAFDHELAIVEEILGHPHPRHRHHRQCGRGEILFQFNFLKLQILQPMGLKKLIGAFAGVLVFKNAEGGVLDISKVTNLAMTAGDATIGNVALTLDANGNPTGAFTGSGIAAGDLVLTATCTNDQNEQETGTTTITFAADTTVTEVDVNVS